MLRHALPPGALGTYNLDSASRQNYHYKFCS